MQTGLRPIMDLNGATIVTSNTGIILTRSPFPLSALYLSQISDIMSIDTMCYCTIGIYEYNKKIPVGTRFSARPDRPWGPLSLL